MQDYIRDFDWIISILLHGVIQVLARGRLIIMVNFIELLSILLSGNSSWSVSKVACGPNLTIKRLL